MKPSYLNRYFTCKRQWANELVATFCPHQPFSSFFKRYLVQKGESKSSHHHCTPPHQKPNLSHCSRLPLGNNKTCFDWGWVGGVQIVLFFKLYPVWQQYICMILTIIWLAVCVKLQLKKGFYTPVWWLWWRQIIQWHYQRSQWSKP